MFTLVRTIQITSYRVFKTIIVGEEVDKLAPATEVVTWKNTWGINHHVGLSLLQGTGEEEEGQINPIAHTDDREHR